MGRLMSSEGGSRLRSRTTWESKPCMKAGFFGDASMSYDYSLSPLDLFILQEGQKMKSNLHGHHFIKAIHFFKLK